jgi:hypothetical protein
MEEIIVDANGEAEFFCSGGSVSVWVDKDLLPKLAI